MDYLLSGKLPPEKRRIAQKIGLSLALIMRILLLASAVWLASLREPVFEIFDHGVSWRDMILLGGGLFLLVKGTQEIHQEVEGNSNDEMSGGKVAKAVFSVVIMQIVALDLVFSLDSVITAIGMTDNLPVMIFAVCIAILVMLFAADSVSRFIHDHPTTKMLALAFLLLIGAALIADGLHFHIPRGYLYFATAFSIAGGGVEPGGQHQIRQKWRRKLGRGRRDRCRGGLCQHAGGDAGLGNGSGPGR